MKRKFYLRSLFTLTLSSLLYLYIQNYTESKIQDFYFLVSLFSQYNKVRIFYDSRVKQFTYIYPHF